MAQDPASLFTPGKRFVINCLLFVLTPLTVLSLFVFAYLGETRKPNPHNEGQKNCAIPAQPVEKGTHQIQNTAKSELPCITIGTGKDARKYYLPKNPSGVYYVPYTPDTNLKVTIK